MYIYNHKKLCDKSSSQNSKAKIESGLDKAVKDGVWKKTPLINNKFQGATK